MCSARLECARSPENAHIRRIEGTDAHNPPSPVSAIPFITVHPDSIPPTVLVTTDRRAYYGVKHANGQLRTPRTQTHTRRAPTQRAKISWT